MSFLVWQLSRRELVALLKVFLLACMSWFVFILIYVLFDALSWSENSLLSWYFVFVVVGGALFVVVIWF